MSISFSPDGKRLACSGDAGVVSVIDIETAERVWQYQENILIPSVAFSPNGKYLAAWGHQLMVWDVSTWKEVRRFQGIGKNASWEKIAGPGQVSTLFVFSPDGTHIATLGSGNLKLFDIKTGKK